MGGGASLINLGDISKPATVLIEKISGALGGYYKPFQIRRIAKAEAEADRIRAEGQIEVTALQRRALERFVAEEARNQDNIEQITKKAISQLDPASQPERIDDDWITNFFDKGRIISDQDMQALWAKALAGEANSPGSFSKRTVNFLASLDKTEAEMFTAFCGFVITFNNDPVPFIYEFEHPIYRDHGITFQGLTQLDVIGLITFDIVSDFMLVKLPEQPLVSYHATSLKVRLPKTEDNELHMGHVILSNTGEQLATICSAKPIDGFYDYVVKKWTDMGLVITPTSVSPQPGEIEHTQSDNSQVADHQQAS